MDEEMYIFFYEGDDTQWIKQFEEKASALKKVINSIELFRIKNGVKGRITYGNPGTALRAFSSAGTT